MSDNEEGSPRSPASSAPSSPLAPVSPLSDQNHPESPTGDAEDIYKDDDAPSSPAKAPGSPGTPGSPRSPSSSPVRTSKVIIDSDDDSDGEGASANKRSALLDSDASDTEAKKKPRIALDSDDSDQEGDRVEARKNLFGDDSDSDDEDRAKKSQEDDLDELVTGTVEEPEQESKPAYDSDDSDGPLDRRGGRNNFEWDFDKMMAEKKAERKRKTKRGKDGGIDIINDDDGMVAKLVERMKHAAKADRNANVERKPAFQKIKMLPEVKAILLRAGIVEVLIENGFMSALSEWLAPLPDKCLPALDIRITILKLLHNPRFWKLDRSTLKQSGLGKAVMMLYKHPNETKENKAIANKLIGEWARPIYHLDTDYSTVSRQEREERDYSRMPEKRKKKLTSRDADEMEDDDVPKRPRIRDAEGLGPTKSLDLKPGDKGYINRARVPKPSTKDYVIRPEWRVTGEFKGEKKASGSNRYEQTFRDFQERTKKSKANRLVKVSLEGRNMGI